MTSYSPTLSHGGGGGGISASESGPVSPQTMTSSLEGVASSSKAAAHSPPVSQGLFSKLRKQAPRLFAKSKSTRPSSGHPYIRGYHGPQKGPNNQGIQSEPPSFTGYSTDQSSSPRTSRPESSSGFFQTASFNAAAMAAAPHAAQLAFASDHSSWHHIHGRDGCWSFSSESAQVQLKETSMLVLTELEKNCLRDIALSLLLNDPNLGNKMDAYVERFSPKGHNLHNQQRQQQDNHNDRRGHGVSRFFSRLSALRFSTGSYSSVNPPPNREGLHRSKFRPKTDADDAAIKRNVPIISESTSVATPNLVFGATLKRCLANEILAERKRLMRLERQSRNGTNTRVVPPRKLEPFSPSGGIVANESGDAHSPNPPESDGQLPAAGLEIARTTVKSRRQHVALNRRSSVNGVGLTVTKTWPSNIRKGPLGQHSRDGGGDTINDLVTDDADSGFQDDGEPTSVKATSFDTGRRFERCDSAGPMPLQVPQFVRKCVRHIETYGMHVEGIFRLGTSKKRIKAQKAEIQRSADFNFTADHSVHDTAALLKEFFRDLPEPLLTRSLYAAFVAVGGIEDRCRAQTLLRLLILLLPSVHRDTLYFLLIFLRTVAAHAVDDDEGGGNKMTSHNLATLFGPNILRMSGFSSIPTLQDYSQQEPVDVDAKTLAAMVKVEPNIMKRQPCGMFIVETKDRADERLAVIAVVQLLIEDHDIIFKIPVELLDQMFAKMFQGEYGSTRHNSTAVKGRCCAVVSFDVVERLLLKRSGCRLKSKPDCADASVVAASNDCCCSRMADHFATSRTGCCLHDSTMLSCTSFSVQSSPTVTSGPDSHTKGNRNANRANDQATSPSRQTADETVHSTLHPNVTACVSRSEGDLTMSNRIELDFGKYPRLTGRSRPKRYGESYAARIRIPDELLHAASTWDELRSALVSPSNTTHTTYSNTLPRITVTVTPSSAPDTPIPSQVRA